MIDNKNNFSSMNAVANTDSQRAIAEVQASMMIAKMNPRNEKASIDRIINSCSRPSLAECAIYEYSKGGTNISGPSIRLAEAMAQQWGNIQFGIRELEQRDGESTVQAFAWDVETNTRREVTFQVPHARYTKQGGLKQLQDPRDIYEMVANQGSRRLRACILAIIPGDIVEMAVNQCEVTLKLSCDTSTESIKKMIDAFAAFGVTKEQIESRIQRRIDAITSAQIVGLKKIYTSIKDGISSASEWFGQKEPLIEMPKQSESYSSNKITGSQSSLLIKKMSEAGLEHDLFCNHFGIENISDLEITKMNDAIGFIEAFTK